MEDPLPPPANLDFRFAHLADAHIGAWPKDPGLRRLLRESVTRALRAVIEEECEFLLIAGDLFHTPIPDPAEAAPVAALLREIRDRGIRIYAIFGSHDYVLNQTSWLDVLSEGGLFDRVAAPTARAEGEAWTLPCVRDERTGAVIAGVPGRAQGLDRTHYQTMDHTRYTGEKGFKIFLFHAGILEYLPQGLREHVPGVPLDHLPPGCDYYAGGHIHATYQGEGPGNHGVLVNPGATFGTSVTDLENISRGITHAGIVIVDVQGGVPHPRWRETTTRQSVSVIDVDVRGCGVSEALDRLKKQMPAGAQEGPILIPKLHGMKDPRLDLTSFSSELRKMDVSAVHLDVQDLSTAETGQAEAPTPLLPEDIETSVLREVIGASRLLPPLSGEAGVRVAKELLRKLGSPQGDGESKEDYRKRIVGGALGLLAPRLDLEVGER